jgi:crotonobetainyl-CoA:carnitine CoA-transferase CaiB-like acyl-CoA transferase
VGESVGTTRRAGAGAALAGIRALELGARAACRACGSLLVHMGAEVVAVEELDANAPAARRATLLAGKRSFARRAGIAEDESAVQSLLSGCDLVIVSSDEAAAWPASIREALEGGDGSGLVVVDICSLARTSEGEVVPDDLAVQAMSGMMETTGLAHGPPCAVDGEPLEMIAALHALAGALAALHAKNRDGLGQAVRVSLMDCAISSHAVFVSRLVEHPDAPATRTGNRHLLASPWNVFRAADGWLLICMASEPQWRRACELMGDPQLAFRPGFDNATARQENLDAVEAAVQAWVQTMDVASVSRVLLEAGIPCGAVAPVDGHPREANLEHRAMVNRATLPGSERQVYLCASPLRASLTPGIGPTRVPAADADRDWALGSPWRQRPAPQRSTPDCRAPLAGVRVIELGHFTTAPLAGRYLANLGAEVIKIEPPGGEVMRTWMPQRHDLGTFFVVNNTGKRNVVLDLKSAAGMSALESLVSTADVLLENLKPGALQHMGLGFERMRALNPGLVYCAVSGFGVDSVYPGRPAYDTVTTSRWAPSSRRCSTGRAPGTGSSSTCRCRISRPGACSWRGTTRRRSTPAPRCAPARTATWCSPRSAATPRCGPPSRHGPVPSASPDGPASSGRCDRWARPCARRWPALRCTRSPTATAGAGPCSITPSVSRARPSSTRPWVPASVPTTCNCSVTDRRTACRRPCPTEFRHDPDADRVPARQRRHRALQPARQAQRPVRRAAHRAGRLPERARRGPAGARRRAHR